MANSETISLRQRIEAARALAAKLEKIRQQATENTYAYQMGKGH